MKLYRTNYKSKDGKERECPRWYLDFFDHNQTRRRVKALKSQKYSEELGRNIEQLVECRASGREPDIKLSQWIEGLPGSLLEKFAAWGLIDGQRTEIVKPLKEHIREYKTILEAKGHSHDYIVRQHNRLLKIIKECRFTFFRDITQSAVEIFLGNLKGKYSATSRGHYLDALKTFCNWARQDRRIINNPVALMEKPARDSEKKGILTPEQFIDLIKTTIEKNVLVKDRTGKTTTGQQRACLYLMAGTTGLRRNELLNLLWSDLHLGPSAFVNVRAIIAKNGKETRQPLPSIAASVLMAVKAQIKPEPADRVFVAFGKSVNTATLIRQDLDTAKIPLKDKDGNEICFHSLRNSYISFLANSEAVSAKTVQTLARHSDPRLTFNTYARSFESATQKALAVLPDFGTFYFDTYFDKDRIFEGACIEDHRGKSSDIEVNTALLQKAKYPQGESNPCHMDENHVS